MSSRHNAPSVETDGPTPVLASVIEHVPVDLLKAYDRNAREHSDRQIAKLAATIRSAGFLVPIIVDEANVIISGHGRLLALRRLGVKMAPVIRAGHLTPGQVRAFRLADNKLHDLSTFNTELLGLELKELSALDLDLLDQTAFEIAEIDTHIESLEEPSDDAGDIIDLSDANPVSRLGDLWQLGAHRLINGSALDPAVCALVLNGSTARMTFSDPPYNVKVQGHVSGNGKVKHREFVQASGEMTEAEFTDFLAQYLAIVKDASVRGALHYVCMDAAHTFELLNAARAVDLRFKTTCTWGKTNAGMGSFYRQQTEFVHVFKNGGDESPHINNIQLGRFGNHRSTLWIYPGVNTFRKGRMEDLAAHPSVKPTALVADAIKDCTCRGDAVLDAFCGSGTTLIAAEKTGRIGHGIELDPIYVDVAIRRWQRLSGKRAVHVESGRPFDDIEAEIHAPTADAPHQDEETRHG